MVFMPNHIQLSSADMLMKCVLHPEVRGGQSQRPPQLRGMSGATLPVESWIGLGP